MQSKKVATATLTFDDLIDESYLEVPAGVDAGAQPTRGAVQTSPKIAEFPARAESPRPAS